MKICHCHGLNLVCCVQHTIWPFSIKGGSCISNKVRIETEIPSHACGGFYAMIGRESGNDERMNVLLNEAFL